MQVSRSEENILFKKISNKKEIFSLLKEQKSLFISGNKKEILNAFFFFIKQNIKKALILCKDKENYKKNLIPDFVKKEISYWPETDKEIIIVDLSDLVVSKKCGLELEVSVAGRVKDLVMIIEPKLIILDEFTHITGLFFYFDKQICIIKNESNKETKCQNFDKFKENFNTKNDKNFNKLEEQKNTSNLFNYLIINKNNYKKINPMGEEREKDKPKKIYVPKINIEEIEKEFNKNTINRFNKTEKLSYELSKININDKSKKEEKHTQKNKNKTHKTKNYEKEKDSPLKYHFENYSFSKNKSNDNTTKSYDKNKPTKFSYEMKSFKKENKNQAKISFILTDLFCEEVVKQIKPNISTLIITPEEDKDLLYLQKEIGKVLKENKIKYNLKKENNLVSLNCKKNERHQMIINLGVPSLKDFKERTELCDEFIILIKDKSGLDEIIEYMAINNKPIPDWLINSEEEEEIDDSDLWN